MSNSSLLDGISLLSLMGMELELWFVSDEMLADFERLQCFHYNKKPILT